MPHETGGPYLIACLFCEKVLREQDGVMSFIRVTDKWLVPGSTEQMPLTVIQTNLAVLMKSGAFRGSAQIILTPYTPSKKQMPPIVIPVVFEADDDRGVAASSPLGFPVQEPGIYWIDIEVNGQLISRASITVLYLRNQLPPSAVVDEPTTPL